MVPKSLGSNTCANRKRVQGLQEITNDLEGIENVDIYENEDDSKRNLAGSGSSTERDNDSSDTNNLTVLIPSIFL